MATIKLIVLSTGEPTPFDGQYVVEYDPSRNGCDSWEKPMICHLVTTPDRDKAKQYDGAGAAMEEYRKSFGIKPDGRPNRPLTAFTVEIG